MRMTSRLLVAATVFYCAGLVSDQARAVVLDMEGVAAPGSATTEDNANRVLSGFNLNILHGHFINNGHPQIGVDFPSNGSDWFFHDNTGPLTLTKVGGGPFSINSFDATFHNLGLGGEPTLNHVIDVVGSLSGGGSISTSFTLDHLDSFETFGFGAGWANLLSVTFRNPATNQLVGGLIAYDNIVVDVPAVPLPAALPLFATVLAGGGLVAWRRKRKSSKIAV